MKKIIFTAICFLIGIGAFAQQKKSTKKATTKSYTTEQAIAYIKDWFEFYNADCVYRNPQARKISNNVFHIKVDVCFSKGNCYREEVITYRVDGNKTKTVRNEYWWDTKVYILTIGTQGKYSVKEKFDY